MTKVCPCYGTVSRKRRSGLALIAARLAGKYLQAALESAGLSRSERDIVYDKIMRIADRLRTQGK